MALALTPISALNLFAGLALVGLALVVFVARPASRLHQLFALMLAARGGVTAVDGAMQASTDLVWATTNAHVEIWLEVVATASLVAVAALFPRRTRLARSSAFWGALIGVTGLLLLAFVLAPETFVERVYYFSGRAVYRRSLGWVGEDFFRLAVVVQAIILVAFARAHTRSDSEIARDESWYLLAGLGAAFAYNFSFSLAAAPWVFALDGGLGGPGLAFLLSGIVGLVAGAEVARLLVLDAREHPERRRRALGLAAILGVPLAVGVLDATLIFAFPPTPFYENSAAVWKLVLGAFLATGMLRYTLFDLDERASRALSNTLAFAVATGLFIGSTLALADLLGAGTLPLLVSEAGGAAVGLAAVSPLRRWLAPRRRPGESGAALDRKLIVYRAALERALDAGDDAGGAADRELAVLRARLGLSEREHTVLEHAVRHAATSVGTGGVLAPGALVVGKYRIARLLGEGSFARTYLARDVDVGRDVALKHVRARTAREAEAVVLEARHLGELDHPNVVRLVAIERFGADHFLVLEFAEGGTLAARLAEGGPLAMPEACAVLDDVLAGLEVVHARGLVHRDVKPANVFFDAQGRAKLGDFGLARATDATRTQGAGGSEDPPGTPAYMAPEQVRGLDADARCDLYACGAVFYESLAGETYVATKHRTAFEVRSAVLCESPRLPIANAPTWANAFLAKALAKDPGLRFQSANEMRSALASAAGEFLARVR